MRWPYVELLDVIACTAAALGVAALMRGPSRALASGQRAAPGLLWRAALAAAWPVLLALLLGSGFGLARLIYHAGLVAALTLGASLLWALSRPAARALPRALSALAWGMSLLALSFGPLALWMTFIEPYWLQITHPELPPRQGLDAQPAPARPPIRVAVLADLQTPDVGPWERRIAQEVQALAPDLIILPGDILQTHRASDLERGLPQLRAFLDQLQAPHGVYLVSGDADHDVQALVQGTRVTLLDDRIITLRVHGRALTLGGLPLRYWTPQSLALIQRLEAMPGQDTRLLIAHRPDVILHLPERPRTDLVIAGHTHGGQVNLPLLGPPITLSALPRHIGAGGMHEHQGRRLYVSRGLGLERAGAPQLRLNCRPELTLLTLR